MSDQKKAPAVVITAHDLSKVENNSLNENQIQQILKKTPQKYLRKRPAKGGGEWTYVSVGYVKKVLNLMFGWNWDFQILNSGVEHGEVWVHGRLTCRTIIQHDDGQLETREIIKEQFGNKEIIFKKQKDENGNRVPLSIGNDRKSAASDALKKCASEIGIAADVYAKEEFNALTVITSDDIEPSDLEMLLEALEDRIPSGQVKNIRRIIDEQEKPSYSKAYKYLMKINNEINNQKQ